MDAKETLESVIKECGMSKEEADIFCLFISMGHFDKVRVLALLGNPTRDKFDKGFSRLIELGAAWED